MWQICRRETGEVLLSGEGARPGQYDLARRDLSGADVAAAGTAFNRGVLTGSVLADARFTGLRLGYLVAPGSDMARADLSHVRCKYLDLRRANLRGASLDGIAAGTAAKGTPSLGWGLGAWIAWMAFANWLADRVAVKYLSSAVSVLLLAMLVVIFYRDHLARGERVRRGLSDEIVDYDALPGLTGICLSHADLSGATLVNARLPQLEAQHASFRGADLRDAVLRGANLVKADLSGADIRGADFRDACMVDAHLSGAVYDEKTRWPADFLPDRHGAMIRSSRQLANQ
jgi:uncharacterized protein YjbI with pentapeptide repeats